jgi:hypothetical protein
VKERVDLVQLVLVSALVMGMAHTIARERIFAPLRERLGGRHTWFGYLVSCPFCASHWLAFALVPLTGTYAVRIDPRIPVLSPLLDVFFSAIVVAVVAAFLRVGFYLVDESQGLVRRRQKDVEEEIATRRLEREELEERHH